MTFLRDLVPGPRLIVEFGAGTGESVSWETMLNILRVTGRHKKTEAIFTVLYLLLFLFLTCLVALWSSERRGLPWQGYSEYSQNDVLQSIHGARMVAAGYTTKQKRRVR